MRTGSIPNAFQPNGKSTEWYIYHSKECSKHIQHITLSNSYNTKPKRIAESDKTICFVPIEDKNSEILILGNLPSKISINTEKGEYYSNTKNHFWRIMSYVLEEEIPQSYQEKEKWLKSHKIALWDVLKCANRKSSQDKDITDEEPNDILGFISSHSYLRLIIINGKSKKRKSPKYFFDKYVGKEIPDNIQVKYLPSTSPANRYYSLEDKQEIWKNNLI